MADLQGRKVFKVFNQDFIVDERYTVTKELGQGAYGIVWYVPVSDFFAPDGRTPLTRIITARQQTRKPKKVLQSRRSPMSSPRRSWRSVRYER